MSTSALFPVPPAGGSPGDTSNKGARSLVLTNSGPLRPPVRRTSAPLRCSSSPNGNGRFRWERSRSEISELSPLGGSERCAACGDAFGRWGGGSQEGEYEIPLLSVSLVPFCTSRKEQRPRASALSRFAYAQRAASLRLGLASGPLSGPALALAPVHPRCASRLSASS